MKAKQANRLNPGLEGLVRANSKRSAAPNHEVIHEIDGGLPQKHNSAISEAVIAMLEFAAIRPEISASVFPRDRSFSISSLIIPRNA